MMIVIAQIAQIAIVATVVVVVNFGKMQCALISEHTAFLL